MCHFKIFVAISLILGAALSFTGCSAPQSERYKALQRTSQQRSAKQKKSPIDAGEFFASNPDATESDYHFKLGQTYWGQRRLEEAFSEFKKTVRLSPYHREALLYMAFLFAQRGDDENFKIAARRVTLRDKKNADIREITGMRAMGLGDMKRAEKELKKAVEYKSDSLAGRVGLSTLYQMRGDYQQAAAELQVLLAKNPKEPIALFELGNCYWRAKQYEKAVEQFNQCLQLYPKSAGLRLSLSRLYRMGNLLDQALAVCQEAQRLVPHSPTVLFELGIVHLARGDADKALDYFHQVKQQSEGYAGSIMRQMIAQAYLQKGDKARAESEVLEGLRQDPQETSLRMSLATFYLGEKRYRDAIEQYQEILQKKPESFVPQFQLARIYERMEDYPQAISAYQRAVSLVPNSQEALNNLAYLYARTGTDLDEALKLAQKADQCARNRPRVIDTLGFVHYQRKEYDEALKYFTRANELSKERPDATLIYHLALAYQQKGMKESAASQLTEALKHNPSPEEAEEMKRLLKELNG
jgi:tetratricopeptide (TPR) repeat protein